jgi:hypothetical protein
MSGLGLYIFHILVVFPLLFYVAFFRGLVPLWVYHGLTILGLVIIVYHMYKAFVRWKSHSPFLWVNIMHILFVGPLLVYIGKNDYTTPKWAFEVLALAAFAALGYNLYQIVLEVGNLQTIRPEEVYDKAAAAATGTTSAASPTGAKPRPS